ncbi:dolichol-phosphate mannosyltransferase subunit 3 [Agrilus planipennis]|uniref:Dolichol-phosphate mannosyltransferase subunit 3 n=1 Tax=Agrilus planipennis TaxID=224129 RepID=A0A1W4WLN2_AGRPL|nr:dolichol-phosphate mannosyltransferase subunit 3 [Agrilus planipennis]
MTKLMEWLLAVGSVFAVWFALITKKVESSFTKQYFTLIFYSPLFFGISFVIYAAVIVLYRTFTFNNCEEAASELQKEIEEAKEELNKLGYKVPLKVK